MFVHAVVGCYALGNANDLVNDELLALRSTERTYSTPAVQRRQPRVG